MALNDKVCVYIISTYFGTFYCGITNNLIRRWKEHKEGKSSYLSKFKPKEVIYMSEFDSRRSASKVERQIKSFGVGKYAKKVNLYNNSNFV